MTTAAHLFETVIRPGHERYIARLLVNIAKMTGRTETGRADLGVVAFSGPAWNGGAVLPGEVRSYRIDLSGGESVTVRWTTQFVSAETPRPRDFVQGAYWNSIIGFEYTAEVARECGL